MERIREINPIIKKAVERECCFTDEEVEFFERFRQEEADRLWNRDMKKAKMLGIQQGVKKGIKKGVKQGVKQGIEQEKIRIVYNMYKNNFDTATICLVLNLTKKEVENILKE